MMEGNKHLSFLKSLDEKERTYEYMMMEQIRINGIYWALTALCLLGHGPWTDTFNERSPLTEDEIISFVRSCKHPSGMIKGFFFFAS